jgi:hypothetical protein
MSSAKTRFNSRAQLQRDDPVSVSSSSTPCWRGVGMIARRRLLCGAQEPLSHTRRTRGRGTNAASFSKSSDDESRMPVVPSDHGWVKV